MDDEMNTAEVLRDEAKENRTREILSLCVTAKRSRRPWKK